MTLHQSGRLTEAEKIYLQILKANPRNFDSLHLLAIIHYQRGDHAQALRQIDAALKVNPKAVEAHTNRGNVLRELRRPSEALASYDLALSLRSDNAVPHNNRGNVLRELRRFDEALASYDKALALKPDYAEALNNRGVTFQELKRLDEALVSIDAALALKPDYAEALFNRGNVLHEQKRFEEALASYDRALGIRPDYAEVFGNRGITLGELRRFEEALGSYERALSIRPDYVRAHWNEAMVRLLIGDFGRGWVKHEWRWKNESLALPARNFAQPLWLGADAIDGKTILLHSEQGFGDTIQFCRYAPLVAARGANVILEVDDPLRELVTTLPGAVRVISRGNPLPGFDFQCPLLSLPLAFGTRQETIPSVTPYLRPAVQASKNWEARLGPTSRSRIGLVWSGNPTHKKDQERSISLRSLVPLLGISATFVSLQKDIRIDDVTVLQEQNNLLQFSDEMATFSDTAALISNLDLVISVDTSIAHLAGALAKPVWVLLPFIPDWRWLLDRDDSPWYPTARLFRQDGTRSWENVITRIHAALQDFIQPAID
jgi:tetratricopeptide (TPR) repeat protein